MSSQDLSLDSVSNLPQSSFQRKWAQNGEICPENAALTRTEKGTFVQGHPGGPGRPKTASITEAYKQILADRGAGELAQVVYNDATTAKAARDRLAAASEITDRTEGKATQRVDMRGIVVMMPAQADLEALDSWAGDEE